MRSDWPLTGVTRPDGIAVARPQARTAERRPLAAEPEPRTDGTTVTLRLYDAIDSWGGDWGCSAKEFAATIDALPGDTSEIRLHLNSPGGDVFEGIAIANMLRAHPANVVVVVDGLAASIASIVAVAGDELVMAPNSELMVHDAWGLCMGNAGDMTSMGALLDHLSGNLADAYAAKGGGKRAKWRDLMLAETWFTAEEAVAVGLADRLDTKQTTAKAAFDLSAFRYRGRAQAPAPLAGGARSTEPKGSTRMSDPKPNAPGARVCGGVPTHDTEVAARSWDPARTVANLDPDLRPSQLRSVYAWVDPDGDPELTDSYAYPHHHGVDGPANLRACVAGIARLNGAAAGPGVPEQDRQAVYEHLAAHVRDSGREPAPLNLEGEGPAGPRLADQAARVLAEVSGLIDAASRVVAVRAGAGKTLSKSNTDLLDWISDDLTRLKALCATPIDSGDDPSEAEVQATFLASVTRINALRGE